MTGYAASTDRETVRAFLELVVPTLRSGEYVEVRGIAPGGAVRQLWCTSSDEALTASQRWTGRVHLYFGLSLRNDRRGTAAACTRAQSLWADIDGKLLRGGVADAICRALDCALPLSAIVVTGNGVHAYRATTQPLDLRDLAVARQHRRLCRALARLIAGPDATPDRVDDPARVLRLPGSRNHKSTPPKPVEILALTPERRSTLVELAQWFAEQAPWALPSDAPPLLRPLIARTALSRTGTRADARLAAYGRAALASVARDLAGTPAGGRNEALYRAAFRAGSLVGAGAVDIFAARAALEEAGGLCGLWHDEPRKSADTLARGLADGVAHPAELPPPGQAMAQRDQR